MSYVPKYDKCLTETDLETMLAADYAAQAQSDEAQARSNACIAAKEKVQSLTYQIEDIKEEY